MPSQGGGEVYRAGLPLAPERTEKFDSHQVSIVTKFAKTPFLAETERSLTLSAMRKGFEKPLHGNGRFQQKPGLWRTSVAPVTNVMLAVDFRPFYRGFCEKPHGMRTLDPSIERAEGTNLFRCSI